MVSRLKHEHVLELVGYCVEGGLRVLAYEFATMGSLHDILHGKEFSFPYTDWHLLDHIRYGHFMD